MPINDLLRARLAEMRDRLTRRVALRRKRRHPIPPCPLELTPDGTQLARFPQPPEDTEPPTPDE